jgi:uncharacterized protein with HEPN domain
MKRYVGDRSLEAFVADEVAVDAAIRTLEIISDASSRLSDEVKGRYPDVPWVLIAGASAVYRNDYDEINAERVYHTATAELESLAQAVAHACRVPHG